MRTTINVNEELLLAAKQRARERGVSLGAVIDDALRRELAERSLEPAPALPVFHGTGVMPGVDLTSNRAIYELLDEGLPLDKLR